MEPYKHRLQAAATAAVQAVFELNIPAESLTVQRTTAPHTGDYTLVVFPLTKHKLGKPEEIAAKLGEHLAQTQPEIAGFEVVKGFLNLTLTDAYWQQFLQDALAAGDAFFRVDVGHGKNVMVEFSSPNTNKPLHLGHLRNNFLGDSISRILAAANYEVTKVNLVNDRGIHIAKSMLAYQRFGNGETPETSGLKGDHLVGKYYVAFNTHYQAEVDALIAQGFDRDRAEKEAELLLAAQEMHRQWEANAPDVHALWKKMNGWVYAGFEETYRRLGIAFDRMYYESETYLLGKEIVDEGLEKGVFYRKEDGSVWVDLTDEKLDHKLLLRADGTSVYITQDLGTAQDRFAEYAPDASLYVVGNEQDYHFQVLRACMKKLGRPWWDQLVHISYGMVDLPTGKMKSREGTVVDADDLLDEMEATAQAKTAELGKAEALSVDELAVLHETLALGALKYFLLKVDPPKRMLFNPEESVEFQGNTGVFLQYSHARLASILRKSGTELQAITAQTTALEPAERALLLVLAHFPEALAEAARTYSPAVVANYTYEVARELGRFLVEVPVLQAETDAQKHFRLALVAQTRRTLEHGLALLGIRAPERM